MTQTQKDSNETGVRPRRGGCQKQFALIGSSLAADRPSGLGDVASGARSVGRPQVAVVRPPIEAEDGVSLSFTDDGSALIHHLTQNG